MEVYQWHLKTQEFFDTAQTGIVERVYYLGQSACELHEVIWRHILEGAVGL